jgi:hypothetical protein
MTAPALGRYLPHVSEGGSVLIDPLVDQRLTHGDLDGFEE